MRQESVYVLGLDAIVMSNPKIERWRELQIDDDDDKERKKKQQKYVLNFMVVCSFQSTT